MRHCKFDATDEYQPLLSERNFIEGSNQRILSHKLYIIQADGVNEQLLGC